MKEKFGEKLNVKIYTTDSQEAKGYTFKGSTNILFENDWVPLDVGMDKGKMDAFLSRKIR